MKRFLYRASLVTIFFLSSLVPSGLPSVVFSFPSAALADSLTTCTPSVDTSTCTNAYTCTCTVGSTTYGPFATDESSTAGAACQSLCEVYAKDASYNWYLACVQVLLGTPLTVNSCTVTAGATSSDAPVARNAVIPILNVPIPGLTFDDVTTDEAGNQQATFLAKYVDALYRFLIVGAAVAAVVMLMVGGLQYILSRGHADAVKQAKSRMVNAVIGLVLVFAAYDIAFLINPDTVRFEALTIKTVQYEETPEEFSDENYGGTSDVADGDVVTIDGKDEEATHLVVKSQNTRIAQSVYTALGYAADDFYARTQKLGQPLNIRLTDASRSLTSQATMFYKNCIKKGGFCSPDTCNIDGTDTTVIKKVGGRWELQPVYEVLYESGGEAAIVAALVAHGKGSNCMHTNNVAIDVWPDTMASDFQFDVEYQNLLIETMYDNEFCRIPNEPWHFELYDLASASCKGNTGRTSDYTRKIGGVAKTYSTSNCKKWSYKEPANCCVEALDNANKPSTMCK